MRLRGRIVWSVAVVVVAASLVAPGPVRTVRGVVSYGLSRQSETPTDGVAVRPFDASSRPDVRLGIVGDVGTGDGAERATADAMDGLELSAPFDALILLGDNVYPDGDAEQLQAKVFGPFGAVLDTPTDLLVALGNHDVRTGDGARQIRAFGLPGRWYARDFGSVAVIVLDSNRSRDPQQRVWLEQTLSTSKATWKIVATHHPPYSAGYHGSDGATRAAFAPLFERYGVQLVVSGHDHDYQRNKVINGVTYIVSGAGAKLRAAGRSDFTLVSWSTLHFLDVAAYPDRLEVRAVDQQARAFDAVTLRR